MARPARNFDLHGNVPEKSPVAMLLIDVINDFAFPAGRQLLKSARGMAPRGARHTARAAEVGIPAVYVNDNFGRWRSDFRQIIEHCRRPGSRGRPIVDALRPGRKDYFVLKPKHSGFFSTTLDTLLTYLGVDTLILVGLTTDNCVLFTASDAYVRDFRLYVPRDCVAAIDDRVDGQALRHIERVLHANTGPANRLDLARLMGGAAAVDRPAPERLTGRS
jgi:nicotinamidase-related amidase